MSKSGKSVQLIVLSKNAALYTQILEELEEECFDSEVLEAHSLSEAMNLFRAVPKGIVVTDPECFRNVKKMIALDSGETENGAVVPALPDRKTVEGEISYIRFYVRMNLGKDLTLIELSGLVGLSPNYLSSLFKRETGMTLRQFIEESRLQKAAYLLEMEESFIGEVALKVGFTSISYFCKVFKSYYGTTPKQYRVVMRGKRLRAGQS